MVDEANDVTSVGPETADNADFDASDAERPATDPDGDPAVPDTARLQ